ncbi:unnamed protein product, partial [Ectocarpus sp. 12 AP-2014]
CIAAKCYSLGARFVDDRPIFGVEPVATGLTPVHFLRHFYYGGIVYIGAKQWKDALDSFLMVSSVDMMLVSLIISGEVPPLPKYASNSVTRHLKS